MHCAGVGGYACPTPSYLRRGTGGNRLETFWPSGKALRLVSRGTSVRIRFGSPLSSKVVVCGHCLVNSSLTVKETLKWLSSLPTLTLSPPKESELLSIVHELIKIEMFIFVEAGFS